jgi:hypothetical protein
MEEGMLRVTVPANSGPGQQLLVPSPDGGMISAIVPDGLGPGSVFLIQPPPAVVVQGVSVNSSMTSGVAGKDRQHLQSQQKQQQQKQQEARMLLHQKGLVKIKIPRGLKGGDQFRVRIADGRTVTVVVPRGKVSGEEFQLKVPNKKQNWHDNPLAVLPMTIGPFLG